jgi:hypothetical protein
MKGGGVMRAEGWEGYEAWSVDLEDEMDSLAAALLEEAAAAKSISRKKADDLLVRVYSGLMLLVRRGRLPN